MWALKNKTPYAAERLWIRDKTGAHHWIVSVKATFEVAADGKLALADEQPPPLLAPEYNGEPGLSSVKYEAEIGPPKPTTDVLVDGLAHTPGGRPAKSVPVTLRVADLEKTVMVHGPRVYYEGAFGLTTTNSRSFTSQPLCYESAFGGADLLDPDPRRQRMDARNPVGKGVAADKRRLLNQPAHTIEYPDGNPAKDGPAGLGPIASYWSPRRELAGTYDQRWADSKKPLLPDDYDERFVLAAPADQRPARHLVGGEKIRLVNMTPDGLFFFELPKIFLTFTSRFGTRLEEHRSRLSTVLIEPERRTVKLVWLTSLLVAPTQSDYLDETLINQKPYLT